MALTGAHHVLASNTWGRYLQTMQAERIHRYTQWHPHANYKWKCDEPLALKVGTQSFFFIYSLMGPQLLMQLLQNDCCQQQPLAFRWEFVRWEFLNSLSSASDLSIGDWMIGAPSQEQAICNTIFLTNQSLQEALSLLQWASPCLATTRCVQNKAMDAFILKHPSE